jgi:hypothetical protein
MGIGDWGLGIGPNPQSPIPNPQSPIPKLKLPKLSLSIKINNKKRFKIVKNVFPLINLYKNI